MTIKILAGGLTLLIVGLLLQLASNQTGLIKLFVSKNQVQIQQAELEKLKARNKQLEAHIDLYKSKPESIEELARYELGLLKPNETFYQLVYSKEARKSK